VFSGKPHGAVADPGTAIIASSATEMDIEVSIRKKDVVHV